MDFEVCKETLLSFLSEPINETDRIFKRFSELPGAVFTKGEKPNQNYLFVPGTKKDPVLLVAHADTVWDKNYKSDLSDSGFLIEGGTVISADQKTGIGADDRAGCACLWLFRESGHSLLIIDGEENSHVGAAYIKKNKGFFKLINEHAFIMAFDLFGSDGYMFHAVKNPKSFAGFLEECGYKRQNEDGGSDIFYLCKKAAGVNVSVGYKNEHKHSETISFDDFYRSVNLAEGLLKKADRKYRIPFFIRVYQSVRHGIAVIIKPVVRRIVK